MDNSIEIKKPTVLQSIKRFFVKNRIDIILTVCIGLLTFFTVYLVCGFAKIGLTIPYGYYGGDDYTELTMTKLLGQEFWGWFNPRIGAPFGNYSFDFTANMLTGFDLLIAKFLYLFTDNFVVVFNLRYLLIFPLAGMIAYGVFRALRLNYVFSAFGGVVFAFSPYIFYREVGHLSLSTCYFIPLSVLLCIWAIDGVNDNYLKIDKRFVRSAKNVFTVIFCALIANNGIGYYPFFTCFFLCVVAVCNLFKTKKLRSVAVPLKIIGGIVLFMGIAISPSIIYKMIAGGNSGAVLRGGADSELYSLKIVQMLLPLDGNGIEFLDYVISSYNQVMPLVNENKGSYLGIAGVCGFLISVILLFRTKNDEHDNPIISVLVRMTVFGVLFATIGGFCSVFGAIVPLLRGFNRISIFLLFISLCVLLLIFQIVWNRIKETVKWKKVAAVSAFAVFSAVCLWDLVPAYGWRDIQFEINNAQYTSDKEFVETIEDKLGDGAMVYQLPYHKCPEAGPVNNMCDYHLYAGVINSDTLKWSYGGTKERDADLWCRYAASLSTSDMIEFICRGGFTGLYIDARAYTADELAILMLEIENCTEAQPLVSANGNLIFYDLRDYISARSIVFDESIYDMSFINARTNYGVNALYVTGDGEKTRTGITLRNGATQFGPYTRVASGDYLIAFYGDGITAAEFSMSYGRGTNMLELTEVRRADGMIIFRANVPDNINEVEFRTHCVTDTVITVRGVKTIKIGSENELDTLISELVSQ